MPCCCKWISWQCKYKIIFGISISRKKIYIHLHNFFFVAFFQGSLEETNDDVSALQMIGLLLFKYYKKHGAEALEPFLKLLCSSGLQCRDEESFGVSKAILWKIIKTHKVCFKPAITYFAVNIDIEDERGMHVCTV